MGPRCKLLNANGSKQSAKIKKYKTKENVKLYAGDRWKRKSYAYNIRWRFR